jgi:hypothetical protein
MAQPFRSYLACTRFVDSQIGRLLDALEESGHAENTIVVIWGDHGWHLGEKAITGKNTLWDDSTRVPLIFAGPVVKVGQSCTQPAEQLDIYPTLIELTGVEQRGDLERYRYYVCMKAQKRGWKNCKSKSVPAAEIEKFVVDKIRHVGHDTALVDEVVEQAKIQSERELGALVAERDELVKELEYWNEAIRVAAPKIKPGLPDATSLEQLADWHESLRRAEHRHAIVSAKLTALQAQALTREDVVNGLTRFEPIWQSLTVREQSRIVQLIVKQLPTYKCD